MSERFSGGFITKTPVVPTTSSASGIWTLDQQEQAQQAGIWPSPPPPSYIEDVFSTYLYTGTGATNNIVNSIDLSGKGGLVWIKSRGDATNHALFDTNRGVLNRLQSNTTNPEASTGGSLTAFNANGFTVDYNANVNASGITQASWTFRKQPKFFDVVTYTGNGTTQNIAHNLGSAPGCVIVKTTSNAGYNWAVYHRSLSSGDNLRLNTIDSSSGAALGPGGFGDNTSVVAPTSTVFTVGNNGNLNNSGFTYVAYLFAHDAGGFGATETENVISCGSWSTTLVGGRYDAIIDLGWEPQWVLFKPTNNTGSWQVYDNMRGWTANTAGNNVSQRLYPNLTNAEDTDTNTQLQYDGIGKIRLAVGASGYSGIYIAIRRGPMKTPTDATKVFSPQTATYSANQVVTTGFPVDLTMIKGRTITLGTIAYDRLRGLASTNTSPVDPQLITSDTSAETSGDYVNTANNTGYQISPGFSGFSSVNWNFQRAPSFFDEVCYTGTGSATTVTHNLSVAPEFMVVKVRNSSGVNWSCYHSALGNTQVVSLNEDIQAYTSTQWNNTTPTSSVFSVGTQNNVNGSAKTYVAYLYATCPGVSKVGSYTGTGALQTINCGFASGARFVLIKRTDEVASGNPWYVWDSARGISSSNDPYLSLNSTAAEVTNTNYVDTDTTGFKVTAAAPSSINASGGTFIFLAIA